MARKQRYPKSEDGTFLKVLTPKNGVQEYYLTELEESTVCFGLGPAGVSKTYLAIYVALKCLLQGDVDKIILTRPIVAVEDVGYLPGDMKEKIHPYMMPLLDALEDHVGVVKSRELLESGKIEVLPLAFMRGRSINRAFILLDEAQNTTREQMKMFLTRLGYDSKMAINGDSTQSDLPKHVESGLMSTVEKLRGSDPSISIVEFSSQHIVRHPLIGTILRHLQGPDSRDGSGTGTSRGLGPASIFRKSSS